MKNYKAMRHRYQNQTLRIINVGTQIDPEGKAPQLNDNHLLIYVDAVTSNGNGDLHRIRDLLVSNKDLPKYHVGATIERREDWRFPGENVEEDES